MSTTMAVELDGTLSQLLKNHALGDVRMNQTVENPDNTVSGETDPQKKLLEGSGADYGTVRTFNRQLILNYLRVYGPIPRVAIAKALGLSRATVSSIIEELINDGLVHEGEKMDATPKGGKRATQVHFNVNAGHIVGIDLGRSHLRIYLTNLKPEIVGRWSRRFDTNIGAEKGLQIIADKADELVKKTLGTWKLVRGIGVSIPGVPDPTSRMLIAPPMLRNWMDVDMPARLRSRLKLDEEFPIYLDNDANMGALGESRYGVEYGIMNLIYIKLSTGIGAGLILNGQLYHGSHGVAGEFGHVLIENDSPPCASCGKHGCLEALSGLHAIVEDARKSSFSFRIQSLKESAITPELMADVIIAAQEGDAASQEVLKRAGNRIGRAIGSYLINVYNPSLILLDGGIVRPSKGEAVYINELLLEVLRQSAEDSSMLVAWEGTKILTGQLGDDAVGLGAVATVIDKDKELNMPSHGAESLVRAS